MFIVKSHHRLASLRLAITEDVICINKEARMYAVVDGVSGPNSPANPPIPYGMQTGGQMAGNALKFVLQHAGRHQNIREILELSNVVIAAHHIAQHQDIAAKAVAGACVAACQIVQEQCVRLVLIGDCFAFYRDSRGVHSLTNFDQAAFELEQWGDAEFARCKKKCGGDIGLAWDIYFPYFEDQQFRRANRNRGQGGHAMLNGDLALADCWTTKEISLRDLHWILICTDGLLPPHLTSPQNHAALAEGIAGAYERKKRLGDIEFWRDQMVRAHKAETQIDQTPHILGFPEGSVIALERCKPSGGSVA